MREGPDRRHDVPRRLVVNLVERAIAQLPPRARMTGAEVADLLLDLRLGIDEVEHLPWTDDVEVAPLARIALADRTARRRRRRLFGHRRAPESTERGD